MTEINYDKAYWKYADDIVNDRIISGHLIKLACQRMLDWSKRDDIYFDGADVDKKINFIQKMKHYEGQYANKPFILLPYQQWMIANIYGWKYTGKDNLRVINNVFILTTRQTGKSFLGAALALTACLCDNEASPTVAFVANTSEQAHRLFDHCKNQAKSLDPKGKIFQFVRNQIRIPIINGNITVLASDSERLDGRHDHMFIRDEGHASKNFNVWNVLQNGQVSRKNPLAISISTAGFNIGSTYPLYNQWENCCNILNKMYEDDTWFAAIYQLDEEDDWKDESVWLKACPTIDVTVPLQKMRDQIRTAINSPANEVNIRTKNLNQWMQSADVWLSYDTIQNVMEPVNIEDYKEEIIFSGVDLSCARDLTAFSICIIPNEERQLHPDKFIFKSWLFIPERALEESPNKNFYSEWIRRGWAFKTSGAVVDYEEVLKKQLEVCNNFTSLDVGYDKYNAAQYTKNAEAAGLLMVEYSQTLGTFNRPTKFLEMLILSNKCIIDANPAIQWCFGNVELMWDHYSNCKPTKSNGDANKKIDPIISMTEALGCYLDSSYFQPQIYVI